MWDKDKAVKYLDEHELPHSAGRCAQHVRQAIEAGGLMLARHPAAKDYGSSLITAGFIAVPATSVLSPRAGDVGIVQPIAGHPDGHMAMFDGTNWVSDFKQSHGLYPGPKYRELKPPFAVYRHPA